MFSLEKRRFGVNLISAFQNVLVCSQEHKVNVFINIMQDQRTEENSYELKKGRF